MRKGPANTEPKGQSCLERLEERRHRLQNRAFPVPDLSLCGAPDQRIEAPLRCEVGPNSRLGLIGKIDLDSAQAIKVALDTLQPGT